MRRTKDDSEKTRETILDAAVKKFCQKGVAITTLSEIAKEAGVTRGAIYWHFKNKMDIFDALHERMHNTLEELIVERINESDVDPMERVQEVCVSVLKKFASDPMKMQSIKLFWVQTDYSTEWALFQEKHQERVDSARNLLLEYFKQAHAHNKLPPDTDPEIISLSVRCYLKGIMLEYAREPDLFDMEECAPAMIEHFFRGLV